MFKKFYYLLNQLGFNPLRFYYFIIGIIPYIIDFIKLLFQREKNRDFRFGFFQPILYEKELESGTMKGHYFHQDLLVARRIFEKNPTRHVDIGSRTDGFVAHVAVFREIEVLDIRPQDNKVKNVKYTQSNLMELKDEFFEYCDSVSSLHAIEHFGLGRYGDPIDYNGHLKAIENIRKILKSCGKFYFSVPIGKQRIEFNAHRVFDINYLLSHLSDKFKLDHFSYVDDNGSLHENVELTDELIRINCQCKYGCGIFEFTKL